MTPLSVSVEDLRSLLSPDLIGQREGKLVVSPRTTEEVAAVTRYANENKLAIEIVGEGTKRGWGNPVVSDILLETAGLGGVREHRWQDLTATVGAGTTWTALQRTLAVHSQRVALDPLWPDAATIGGAIASNDSGVLRSRYGSLRDLIIGMTIVLSDGTIARSGGKVVKNVAGYDLHKLMTGAFGTLGVITEVTFRLHPATKSSVSWTITSDDCAALDRVRHQLADSTIFFEALQMRTSERGFALDVRIVSLPECIEEHSSRLHALAAPLPVVAAGEEVWSLREHSFKAKKVTVKVAISARLIAELTSYVLSVGGECVTQQSGIMLATLPSELPLISSLRDKAEASKGSLTVLYWPEGHAARPEIWGAQDSSLSLMREIKRQFDPNRTLNPGRFLGGI